MWERNINWLLFVCTVTGDWTCSPGTCPDQESNRQSFALRDNAQPAEPHWPENIRTVLKYWEKEWQKQTQTVKTFLVTRPRHQHKLSLAPTLLSHPSTFSSLVSNLPNSTEVVASGSSTLLLNQMGTFRFIIWLFVSLHCLPSFPWNFLLPWIFWLTLVLSSSLSDCSSQHAHTAHGLPGMQGYPSVSYTHLRAHET